MSKRELCVPVQPPKEARKPEARRPPRRGRPLLSDGSLSEIDRRLFDLLRQTRAHNGIFPASPQEDSPPTTVIVAVSGGADSVSLLHLLTRMRPDWSLHLVAAHLDHGLRPESADDARFVAEMATRWGLPLATTALPPGALAREGNLEAAARRARYRFLAQVAIDHQFDGSLVEVAVAHTANDQAETVLMNLIRGSGLDGLAGMRPVRPLVVDDRPVPGVRVVRPLLGVSRTEIIQYLNQHNVPGVKTRPIRIGRWCAIACGTKFCLACRRSTADRPLPSVERLRSSLPKRNGLIRTRARHCAQRGGVRESVNRKEEQENPRHTTPTTPPAQSARQTFDLPAFRALGVADQRRPCEPPGFAWDYPRRASVSIWSNAFAKLSWTMTAPAVPIVGLPTWC